MTTVLTVVSDILQVQGAKSGRGELAVIVLVVASAGLVAAVLKAQRIRH
jgi:hypothetical protein